MSFWKPLRELCIKWTDHTHGYQGIERRIISLHRLWSLFYDFSVNLDPAYTSEMKRMIDSVVREGDTVLDIGCGTGIGTVYASRIARRVVGIDLSIHMVRKLRKKILGEHIENIEVIVGRFPQSLPKEVKFHSTISSFAMAHIKKDQRRMVYEHIFDHLYDKGRVGLFSAQGEIASTFETRDELLLNLESCGFKGIEIVDVSHIYRITRAQKG